jgi:hypothetical protein
MEGTEAAQEIRRRGLLTRVLMLSAYEHEAYVRGLGKLFASQYFKAFIVGAVVGLVVLLLLDALWTPTLPKNPVLFTVYRLLGAPTRLLEWADPFIVQMAPGGDLEHLGPAYYLLILASFLSMAVSYGALFVVLMYGYSSLRRRRTG